jgi:hypothetical protein
VLLESETILMKLMAIGDIDHEDWRTTSLNRIIAPGSYRLDLQSNVKESSARLTILLAGAAFYREEYLKENYESLRDCAGNIDLPLTLNKDSTS